MPVYTRIFLLGAPGVLKHLKKRYTPEKRDQHEFSTFLPPLICSPCRKRSPAKGVWQRKSDQKVTERVPKTKKVIELLWPTSFCGTLLCLKRGFWTAMCWTQGVGAGVGAGHSARSNPESYRAQLCCYSSPSMLSSHHGPGRDDLSGSLSRNRSWHASHMIRGQTKHINFFQHKLFGPHTYEIFWVEKLRRTRERQRGERNVLFPRGGAYRTANSSLYRRRRTDNINNICVLEGIGQGENLQQIVPKRCFSWGGP